MGLLMGFTGFYPGFSIFSMYCPKMANFSNLYAWPNGSTLGLGPGFLGSIPSVYNLFAFEFSMNCPKITGLSNCTHSVVAARSIIDLGSWEQFPVCTIFLPLSLV